MGKRVEVTLKLMLDVDEATQDEAQKAFVSLLGDIGPDQMSEGVELTGYEEDGD